MISLACAALAATGPAEARGQDREPARAERAPQDGAPQDGAPQDDELQPTESERVRFATIAARSRYEENMAEELETGREEIDELERQRSIEVNVEKLTYLRSAVAELKDLHEDAKDSLERLGTRDGETWLRARRQVESDTAAFWSRLAEVKTALGLN